MISFYRENGLESGSSACGFSRAQQQQKNRELNPFKGWLCSKLTGIHVNQKEP
jgi:hypothetical protein